MMFVSRNLYQQPTRVEGVCREKTKIEVILHNLRACWEHWLYIYISYISNPSWNDSRARILFKQMQPYSERTATCLRGVAERIICVVRSLHLLALLLQIVECAITIHLIHFWVIENVYQFN